MFHLAPMLGTQHGPTCFLCFARREVCLHGVVSIKCGLQENLGAVGRGCFVRIV
jgi:hypothetical protein